MEAHGRLDLMSPWDLLLNCFSEGVFVEISNAWISYIFFPLSRWVNFLPLRFGIQLNQKCRIISRRWSSCFRTYTYLKRDHVGQIGWGGAPLRGRLLSGLCLRVTCKWKRRDPGLSQRGQTSEEQGKLPSSCPGEEKVNYISGKTIPLKTSVRCSTHVYPWRMYCFREACFAH